MEYQDTNYRNLFFVGIWETFINSDSTINQIIINE